MQITLLYDHYGVHADSKQDLYFLTTTEFSNFYNILKTTNGMFCVESVQDDGYVFITSKLYPKNMLSLFFYYKCSVQQNHYNSIYTEVCLLR